MGDDEPLAALSVNLVSEEDAGGAEGPGLRRGPSVDDDALYEVLSRRRKRLHFRYRKAVWKCRGTPLGAHEARHGGLRQQHPRLVAPALHGVG